MADRFLLRIDGVKQLIKAVKKLPDKMRAVAEREIKTSMINVQRVAKRATPVDTGRLRSSLRFTVSDGGLTGEVFTDVSYAAFVEFGTGQRGAGTVNFGNLPPGYSHGPSAGMVAQPFLFPAWFHERQRLLKRLREITGRALG